MISIDLQNMQPIPGARTLHGKDFTAPQTQAEILAMLGGDRVNSVLSDMAPNATGVKSLDHDLIIDLSLSALKFSVGVLEHGGHFVCKIWQGGQQRQLQDAMHRVFKDLKVVKPHSSRMESAEIFLLGKYFKGLQQ